MPERTINVIATVSRNVINARGEVSTNSFDIDAFSTGRVVAIDPYISIEAIDGGAVITVTDAQGSTSATIYNGAAGATGAKGDKGDKGDTGNSYVLTSSDKSDIATLVYGMLTNADTTSYGGSS